MTIDELETYLAEHYPICEESISISGIRFRIKRVSDPDYLLNELAESDP